MSAPALRPLSPTEGTTPEEKTAVALALWIAAIYTVPIGGRTAWVEQMTARIEEIQATRRGIAASKPGTEEQA